MIFSRMRNFTITLMLLRRFRSVASVTAAILTWVQGLTRTDMGTLFLVQGQVHHPDPHTLS